jgi:hypothetical protein
MKTHALKAAFVLAALCVLAEPVFAQSAQSTNYIGGSAFADVKLFGANGASYYPHGDEQ